MNNPEQSQAHQTGFAIASIVIAVLFLSLSDAIIKYAGVSLPIWQMVILRSCLALPILGLILFFRRPISMGSLFWVSVRSSLLVLMWLFYYLALPSMALSLAAAAYYTGPIFIVILTAINARKFPALRVYLAIALGFVGVLIILRPESSEFQLITLLPILAALLYAISMVITSTKCLDSDPIVLVAALNIAFVIGGMALAFWSGQDGSFLFGPWASLDLNLVLIISALALTGVVGSLGAAIAYQKGPPATIAAFDYSYLVFSVFWGMLLFGEIPGWLALCGILAIASAGLLSLRRES